MLGMDSSTYFPEDRPDITERVLQMVARKGEILVPADGQVYGLVTSVPGLCKLFAELLGEESKVLGREMKDMFFEGQFGQGSAALASVRGETENGG